MIQRTLYIERILPFVDKDIIKVITGIRRSGKTVLMNQVKEYLLNRGISPEQIISLNFESMQFEEYKTAKTLYEYVKSLVKNTSQKTYIFIDEIQNVAEWERAVNSFRVDFNCDIYITGSNSNLLSGELATHLSGRYVKIDVYPFTFKEAKEMMQQKSLFTTDEVLFQNFIKFGGMPQRFEFSDENAIYAYLRDLYEAIILKDIVSRNEIKNIDFLQKLLAFMFDTVGKEVSARSLYQKFSAEGIGCSTDSILNYLTYIQNAFILYAAERYDITGKKLLETNKKYYCADLGLRNCLKSSEQVDNSKLLENLVYLELCARGWNVKVGKLLNKEIDFVCYKNNDRMYVQVAYLITKDDEAREFGNLEKIKDSYRKFVISSDNIDMSRNGIIHKNIISWLQEIN
jgi:uncharacterized protein